MKIEIGKVYRRDRRDTGIMNDPLDTICNRTVKVTGINGKSIAFMVLDNGPLSGRDTKGYKMSTDRRSFEAYFNPE